MLRNLKYKLLHMFRELLVYHSSSLEFRAEILTLMILSEKIKKCEKNLIEQIAHEIYPDDSDRARVLTDTVYGYHEKIVTQNGLEYNDLIAKLTKDVKRTPRFAKKINVEILKRFRECQKTEEDRIFHDRVVEFLASLKAEYEQL